MNMNRYGHNKRIKNFSDELLIQILSFYIFYILEFYYSNEKKVKLKTRVKSPNEV